MGIDLKKLDAGKIETALYDFIRPMFDESDVYVMGGSRNTTANQPRQIYCHAPIEIKDRGAFGQTISRVEIFAEKISGIKNASELSRIKDVVLDKMQDGIRLGDYWFEYVNEISGDDKASYNYIFLNLATKIL